MLIRSRFSSMGMVATLALILSVGQDVCAQGGSWQAERANLMKTVNERVAKQVAAMIDKEKTAQVLHIPWPIQQPSERKDQIVARIQARVDKEARVKFPEAKRKEFQKEAEELYKLYKPGDLVPEFKLARKYGPGVVVRTGHLIQVTQRFVRVGTRWLIPADLTPEMKARFYEEDSERMIKLHAHKKNLEYDREIDTFKREHMQRRLPLALMSDHYCPKQPDYIRSIEARNWWSHQEAVDNAFAIACRNAENMVRGKIEQEVFQANGYVRVKERNNEWMPKAEVEALRQKQREEEERKKGMDFFGDGGGGGGQQGEMMGEPGMGPGPAGEGNQKADDGFFD